LYTEQYDVIRTDQTGEHCALSAHC